MSEMSRPMLSCRPAMRADDSEMIPFFTVSTALLKKYGTLLTD